jgi:peptide/nickel transport system permease protein
MSTDAWLGTDYIGHDVLSRVLFGGTSVLLMSLAATTAGAFIGVVLGLLAGYIHGWIDDVIMRTLDLVLAFPHMVLILMFVSLVGPMSWLITLLVAMFFVPGIARVTRGLALDAISQDYVQAAELVGTPPWRILTSEILPNLMTPLTVEISVRMTWAIIILAGLSFLGFGVRPPNADWGLMTNENRDGIELQSWAILAPTFCIAILTVGTSLMAEGLARTMARVDRLGHRP